MILPVDHNQVTWSIVLLDDLCELLRRQDWRKSDESRVHASQQCHHHCRQCHVSVLGLTLIPQPEVESGPDEQRNHCRDQLWAKHAQGFRRKVEEMPKGE